MTQTIATQIHELSRTINAIADANPHDPTLKVMAWAFDDAANFANGRLRHLLNVPASAVPEPVPWQVVDDQPANNGINYVE